MSNVVVVGASAKEDRYSNKAMKMLAEYGHIPIPVAPAGGQILGRDVRKTVAEVNDPVDTVTLYIGPASQDEKLLADLVLMKPRRVIFNPGTENETMENHLAAAGIETIEACTLVMLRTGQF